MAITVYGDITARTAAYVVVDLLKRGMPYLVLEKFGQAKILPANKTMSMKFRRYEHLALATTPLVEGVTPTSVKLRYTDVVVNLRQYGSYVELSDIVADTHEDPILKENNVILGEQAAKTTETIRFNAVKAGVNVFYANGALRASVNTPITLARQRAVTRGLKRQNAARITSVVKSTPAFNTESVLPSYIGIGHTDFEADIRSMPGFIDVKDYGQVTPYESEVGAVEDVRYLLSPIFEPWADGGAAYAGSGTAMVTTSAVLADVYPMLYVGRDSYGIVALKGKFAVEMKVLNPGTPRGGDPLGQRGSQGWKTMQGAVILNDAWLARLECAVTAL
jgi:N4-gp56 family major capsid protein